MKRNNLHSLHFFKRPLLKSFIVLSLFLSFVFTTDAQVDVTATAGTLNGSYLNLSSAFSAINAGTHQGDIIVEVTTSITDVANSVLNSSGAGSASYSSVLIRPSSDGVVVSFATTSGRGVIELNGADNVTIDGDNPNTAGINRNLTIVNTASNTTGYTSVVRLALSTLVNSADNNIVRNCILNGNATGRNIPTANSTTGTEHTTYGILVGGNASTAASTTAPSAITSVSTTIGTGITASAFTADNNLIDACARGISVNGSAITVVPNMAITNNLIGSATAGNSTTVYSRGLSLQGHSNALISGNTVRNMAWYVGTAEMGIAIGDVSATAASATIERNIIAGVNNQNTGTFGAYGINLAGGNGHIVRNNFVYGITGDMTGGGAFSTTFGLFGIRVGSGTGHSIIYNSVNLSGLRSGTATTSLLGASLAIVGTGQTGCDVRNNILSNTMTGGTTSIAYVSLYLPSGATSAMNLSLNNNLYYCGSNSASQGIAQVSTTSSLANLYLPGDFLAGSTTPTSNLRAYTSTLSTSGTNDNASAASTLSAPFISATDLHININAGNVMDLDGKAAVIASVTSDFDNDVRNTSTPDIGADEFQLLNCSSALGGTIANNTITVCENGTVNMSTTGSTVAIGILYQWEISSTGGGVGFANVSGGNGANTTSYTTAPLTPGIYYYRLNVTCSFGPITDYSNELMVTVVANPTVTVSPSNATICSPGGLPVSLTASGATSYTWTPSTGLSATTGSSVTANPTVTTEYIVTGSVGLCSSTDTAFITVSPIVSISDVTATPPYICPNTSSLLNVNANFNLTAAGYLFGTGAGATLDPMVGATTVVSTSVDDTPMPTPASIGFNFLYEGVSYSQFSASPDGWILLGGATAASQFTNDVISTTNVPKIYPYWDDVATGTNGYVKTLLTGTAPNRIFIVEWFVTIPRNTTGAANSTFQAWLYETSNKIEFRYGTMNPGSMGASVGLTGSTATNFTSLTVSNNTASTTVANNTNSTQPASGTYYTFDVPTLTYAWLPSTFISGQESLQSPTATSVTATTMYVVTVSLGGCSATDSVEVNIDSLSPSSSITDASICQNDSLLFNGIYYSATGTYVATLTNAVGCDSTATLNLTVNQPTFSMSYDTICTSSLPYTWNDSIFTEAGTKTVHFTNALGCDSAATLLLTVNLPTNNSFVQVVCDSITWNGSSYTSSGIYTYSYTNSNGCASEDTLYLTVNYSSSSMSYDTICSSVLPYTWNDSIFTEAGIKTVHFTNALGCDSAATLMLTVNQPTNNSFVQSVCDSYTWNGNSYTNSGIYTYSYTNSNGCASEDTLYLTVNYSSTSMSYDTICSSSLPYTWNDSIFTEAGTKTVHLLNAVGCDSAATLTLTVNQPTHNLLTQTACNSFTWNGNSYSTSGTYTYGYSNANGCASVDTLKLTINYSSTSMTYDTICSSSLPYTWNDSIFTGAGTKTVHLVNTSGCDSAATLNLAISSSPVANFSASSLTGNCPLAVNFTDLSQTTGSASYQWTFYNETPTPVTSTAKNPQGIVYNAAGSFAVKLVVTDDCGTSTRLDSNYITVSCNIGIIETLNNFNWSVFPNPTTDVINIVGENLMNDNYRLSLTDVLGQIVSENNITVLDNQIKDKISLDSFANGIYYLTISNAKAKNVFKIQKQ